MKVIFLDIDGVLNTTQTFIEIRKEWKETGKRRIEIDLERVQYLKEIVDATGAKIVLSSAWRAFGKMTCDGVYQPKNEKMASLINIFAEYGLTIYDVTPRDPKGWRENEISAWLKDKEVESFIILDDDSYDLQSFLHKELIKTSITKDDEMITNMNPVIGLCENHVKEAIEILNHAKHKRLERKKKR